MCTKAAVTASILTAGMGRAGTVAASHGARASAGAASMAGTAGATDPMSAGITMAIGRITAVAIASESSPVRRATGPALRHARAPAQRRVFRATRVCGARLVRVTAACGAPPVTVALEAQPAEAVLMCVAVRQPRAAETRTRPWAAVRAAMPAVAPVLAAAVQ